MRKILLLVPLLLLCAPAFAAGGTCPSGANYVSPTSAAIGGNNGSITLSSLGITSCFYIAANGSDSNDGLSEASGHPWLHAPGMPSCSGTCASTTVTAGEGFIFRGGDTWHFTSGSPGTGGAWTWGTSGNSSNPVYLGIDTGWYSGGSFARPVLSMDNPLSTNQPSSCTAAADDSNTFLATSGRNYLIIDGFEGTGACWNAGGNAQGFYIQGADGTGDYVERVYTHGWTMSTNATADGSRVGVGGATASSPGGDICLYDVVDGADSTFGARYTTPSSVASAPGTATPTLSNSGATGFAMSGCIEVDYSVVRHVSNGVETNYLTKVHDNLFEYQFESFNNTQHGNIVETLFGTPTGTTAFEYYNNVVRNVSVGITTQLQGNTMYVFNNVWENDQHDNGNPNPNCIMMTPNGFGSGSSVVTAVLSNNTIDNFCLVQDEPPGANNYAFASGSTTTFENWHFIGTNTTLSQIFTCGSGNSCGFADSGGDIAQTVTVANGQGYVLSNNYAPTSGSNATVHAGNNISSQCSTYSADSALCSGTSNGVTESSGWGGYVASYPAITVNARPGSGAWDAGAYQFSATAPPPPAPFPAILAKGQISITGVGATK
jgi:hypothetical protein